MSEIASQLARLLRKEGHYDLAREQESIAREMRIRGLPDQITYDQDTQEDKRAGDEYVITDEDSLAFMLNLVDAVCEAVAQQQLAGNDNVNLRDIAPTLNEKIGGVLPDNFPLALLRLPNKTDDSFPGKEDVIRRLSEVPIGVRDYFTKAFYSVRRHGMKAIGELRGKTYENLHDTIPNIGEVTGNFLVIFVQPLQS